MLTKNETDCNEVEQRYYSMKEAAAYAGVAINTLRRWVYRDGLPAARHGRVVRIRKDELERWLEPNITPAKAVA
ncbi:helix-turn-helix domain-containing protein [Varibaculum cambriense]|uniref:helix-turn-helix domain-containing protein n=1 Tax=Varibaculum cambriense TaxID=184870 RepID=UPI0028FE2D6C|nr:helix-turn-helix domain-containing protein [Varibaculum cambriense]MDU1224787.1 helix-turn-helix domain-containing protein [Varibaculum cambriense]